MQHLNTTRVVVALDLLHANALARHYIPPPACAFHSLVPVAFVCAQIPAFGCVRLVPTSGYVLHSRTLAAVHEVDAAVDGDEQVVALSQSGHLQAEVLKCSK